eukprot:jgi/Mesen1/7895/ME000420S07040
MYAIEAVGFGRFQYMMLGYAGVAWMAEAMELMLLSFVGPAVQDTWQLSNDQESAISSVVFVGMLVGAYCWGILAGFSVTAVLTFVAATLSAFAPSFPALLALRGLVGVGLGGAPVVFSLFMEFVPAQRRGFWMVAISLFWTLGSVAEASLAWGRAREALEVLRTMASMNRQPLPAGRLVSNAESKAASWRASGDPELAGERQPAGAAAATWGNEGLVEAAGESRPGGPGDAALPGGGLDVERGHSKQGRKPEMAGSQGAEVPGQAEERTPLLRNGFEPPENADATWQHERSSQLTHQSSAGSTAEAATAATAGATAGAKAGALATGAEGERGEKGESPFAVLQQLVAPPLRRSTALLWGVFFANAFTYYGLVLLTSQLTGGGAATCSEGGAAPAAAAAAAAAATGSAPGDGFYRDVLITSAAELPGIAVAAAIVDRLGRKKSISVLLAITGIALLPLIQPLPEDPTTLLLFGARGSIMGAFQILFVYAPEVYPTSMRSTGLGIANSFSRLGGILCPFVAVGLVRSCQQGTAVSLFVLIPLVASIAVLFFPTETSGKGLEDTISIE